MAMERQVSPASTPVFRNWLRFSLRSGLVVVTILCIWLGYETNRARRQADAIGHIKALGGFILFDYQLDENGAQIPNAEPWAPKWLRNFLGEDHFRRVSVVDLNSGSAIRRKKGLVITDNDLALLDSLPDVNILEFNNCYGITDEGLVHLKSLKKLRTLYLYGTAVKGAGLRYIANLGELENIQLGLTPLQDVGIEHLAQLPRLRWLVLESTKISDAGLAYLAKLDSLQELQLQNTDIGDAGVAHLHGLLKLKQCALHLTNVTAEGIHELERALPNCVVSPTSAQLSNTQPAVVELWPTDQHPTTAEFIAKVNQLGGTATVDQNRPDRPIRSLMIMDSNISDASFLRLLAETPDLEELYTRREYVGDAFVKGLPSLPKLQVLALDGSRITDIGLPHLGKLTSLNELTLCETRITDKSVASLKSLTNLKQLNVSHTRVTQKGVQELKKFLPDCRINF